MVGTSSSANRPFDTPRVLPHPKEDEPPPPPPPLGRLPSDGPPPLGFALIFIPAGGGGLPLGPPPPSALIHLRIRVLGTLFRFGQFFPPAPSVHLYQGSLVTPLESFLPPVADTMSQGPISTFFSTPVQLCPPAKRDDVINATLYFCFQDRWTGKKRQEAYSVAQKACSTLFLNTPRATLCEWGSCTYPSQKMGHREEIL